MSEQELDDLEAFLRTLTDADVVNQVSAPQAVPALGASGSVMRILLLTLFAAGLSSAGVWRTKPRRGRLTAPRRQSPFSSSRFRRTPLRPRPQ